MPEHPCFADMYARGETPWDSGRPDAELIRATEAGQLPGKTLLEFGCGTGTSAIELTRRGYKVTAVDYVPQAVELAKKKFADAKLNIDVRVADITTNVDLGGPYDVLFDRGVYHSVRHENLNGFRKTLERVTRKGSLWLSLAGNAKEQMENGPPRVSEQEIRAELQPLFEIAQLRELRLETNKADFRPLFWSILMRRK